MKLKWLFFAAAAFLFFALYFHSIIEFDQDLGRHLLTGKIIWQTHQVPGVNLYSYTWPNYPFINSHWLSEVIFHLISRVSLPSLIIFKTFLMITAGLLTLVTTYKFSRNLTAAALAFLVFVPILLERTEIRPEIFSYLLTTVFLFIILYKPRFIWLLPVLEIFWVNLHIYFILGPALAVIFLITHRSKKTLAIVFLVFLATLLNPHGLSGALYPLTVFNNYGYTIVENQNPFFLESLGVFNPNISYFKIAIVVFAISFLISLRRQNLTTLALSALLILPFLHIRSFPYLFLIGLPLLAYNLSYIKFPISPTIIISFVIALTLFRSFRLTSNEYYQVTSSPKQFGLANAESYKPALNFVIANHLSGPIFNNFDIGSYLDYRLYPNEKVFVDGRPEAYPVTFFQNLYIPMQQTPENFQKVDDVFKFNLIIFSHTDTTPWAQNFLSSIIKNDRYSLVFLDSTVAVFVKKPSPLPKITNRGLALSAVEGPRDLMSLARISQLFGWSDQSKKYYLQATLQNPNSPNLSSRLILF